VIVSLWKGLRERVDLVLFITKLENIVFETL
jgi:hypothetical protein